MLPEAALEYFRMDRFDGDAEVEPSFQIVVVLKGQISVEVAGDKTELNTGTTTLLKHADGRVKFHAGQDASLVVIRPPL